MNKTEGVIGHLLSNSQHVSAMVTDDTEVWETHNKLVEHIRELDRKAEAFDRLYAEFDKGDKDLSKADFDEVYKLYESGVRR